MFPSLFDAHATLLCSPVAQDSPADVMRLHFQDLDSRLPKWGSSKFINLLMRDGEKFEASKCLHTI